MVPRKVKEQVLDLLVQGLPRQQITKKYYYSVKYFFSLSISQVLANFESKYFTTLSTIN